jgi:hypothetical protein
MNVARLSLSMAALLLATIPSFAEDILGTWLRTPPWNEHGHLKTAMG